MGESQRLYLTIILKWPTFACLSLWLPKSILEAVAVCLQRSVNRCRHTNFNIMITQPIGGNSACVCVCVSAPDATAGHNILPANNNTLCSVVP